jgi:hypothetical protein
VFENELKAWVIVKVMNKPYQNTPTLLSSFSGTSIAMTGSSIPIGAADAKGTDGATGSGAGGGGGAAVDKKKAARCTHADCRVKLGLLGFDCKCGAKYCSKHRYPEAHDCDYDYREAGTDLLKKQLASCTADKLGGDRC